ncbi:extracellular solute-binding protein (family 7), partial [Xylophilus ampelinus]
MHLAARRCLLALAAGLALAGPAAAQKVQAITQVAPNLPQYTKVDQPLLRDGIAKATDGKVEVVLSSWPERNVNGPEVLRLVRSGQVDIAAAPLTTVSGDVPLLDAFDLAGMNPDIRQARKVADAMVPVVNRELFRLGIRLVATYPFSGQMLFCRKPVASLADLKGLKV